MTLLTVLMRWEHPHTSACCQVSSVSYVVCICISRISGCRDQLSDRNKKRKVYFWLPVSGDFSLYGGGGVVVGTSPVEGTCSSVSDCLPPPSSQHRREPGVGSPFKGSVTQLRLHLLNYPQFPEAKPPSGKCGFEPRSLFVKWMLPI